MGIQPKNIGTWWDTIGYSNIKLGFNYQKLVVWCDILLGFQHQTSGFHYFIQIIQWPCHKSVQLMMRHHRHTHSSTVIRTKPGSPTVYPSRWDFTVFSPVPTITDLVSSYWFLQESLAPKNVMFIYCLFICLFVYCIYIYIQSLFPEKSVNRSAYHESAFVSHSQRPWRGAARSSVPTEATRTTPSKPSVSCRFPSRSTPIVRAHRESTVESTVENMKDLGVIRECMEPKTHIVVVFFFLNL